MENKYYYSTNLQDPFATFTLVMQTIQIKGDAIKDEMIEQQLKEQRNKPQGLVDKIVNTCYFAWYMTVGRVSNPYMHKLYSDVWAKC